MERLAISARVVRLIDSGAVKNAFEDYYVMERGDGSLEDLAPPDGYEAEAACQLFREIILGVGEVHAAQIVHRDLKPANIILFSGRPKISDLGLSLLTDLKRVTPTDEAVGPRYYMAPELEHGRNLDVDARADIYSLGKILYWLLSGGVHLPRERFSDHAYRLRERNGEAAFDVFDAVFNRTLTPYPRERFKNVQRLLEEFDECVANFIQHPDRTFRKKLGGAALSEPKTAKLVKQLSPRELKALWDWATKRKQAFSFEVLLVLAPSLDPLHLNRWLGEIDKIPHARSIDAIKSIAQTLFLSASQKSTGYFVNHPSTVLGEALRYGIEHGSAEMRESIASNWSRLLVSQPDLIGPLLAKGNLTPSAKAALAVTVFREDFAGQFAVMKELLRTAGGNVNVIEAAVAGLVRCREEEALALLENALSDLPPGPHLDAALRGFAWGEPTPSQIEPLLKSPRVPAETRELLRVLGDILVEAAKKKEEDEPGDPEE